MHQFMYDNFFEILLFGITCIQQQYRFSVITVYFEILAEKEEEREAALKELEEILQKLGYSIKDTIRKSYLSMLLAKSSAM